MKCDNCGCNNSYIKKYKHEYNTKGINIVFDSDRRFCSNCNSLVYDSELDNEASKKAILMYTKKIGIEPEKIVSLRKQYGLSQEQFSKIIGCAKKTLVSYENGNSIPNDIYVITLKTLLDNPDVIKLMIDSNKEKYSELELEKINNKLNKYFSNNFLGFINNSSDDPNEYNGYCDINKNKIIELICILSKNGIKKTKLLKEMFYSDFIYYKNSCTSITGLEYCKLPFGPVPDDFDNIINYLYENKIIDYEIKYEGDYEAHIITSKVNNVKELSKDELDVINRVVKFFDKFSSVDIENYSHKEKGYIETNDNKKISYDYAFDFHDNI